MKSKYALVNLNIGSGIKKPLFSPKLDAFRDLYLEMSPKNLKQFKYACSESVDSDFKNVSLGSCRCGYYNSFSLPCKHMMSLALYLGMYDDAFEHAAFLEESMKSLSEGAARKFSQCLWAGCYESDHSLSDLGRFKKPILDSGLIIQVDDKNYRYSDDVISNLFYVLFWFMTYHGNIGYVG